MIIAKLQLFLFIYFC